MSREVVVSSAVPCAIRGHGSSWFGPAPLKIVTELGSEKRCMTCGEYWPADREFFEVMRSSRDGLTPRCIACIKAKLWQLPLSRGAYLGSNASFAKRDESCAHNASGGQADGPDSGLQHPGCRLGPKR